MSSKAPLKLLQRSTKSLSLRLSLASYLAYLVAGCAQSQISSPVDGDVDKSPPIAGESAPSRDMEMSDDASMGGELSGGDDAGGFMGGEQASGDLMSGEQMSGEQMGGEQMGGEPAPLNCEGALTACGVACVDLNADPLNCGGCGRTCRIPYADAACVDGACQIGQCEPNYLDADGAIENGCELFDDCVVGEQCETQCLSEGVTACEAGIESCLAPAESCNLADDDCDGACDEDWSALGCRVGIHRGYGQGEHVYSSDINLVTEGERSLEFENYFYLYQEEIPNGRPVFFCRNRGDQRPFLSNQTDCGIGRAPITVLGFWLASPACGATPLYALYLERRGDFFYTTRAAERDSAMGLGYEDRGIAGYIWID